MFLEKYSDKGRSTIKESYRKSLVDLISYFTITKVNMTEHKGEDSTPLVDEVENSLNRIQFIAALHGSRFEEDFIENVINEDIRLSDKSYKTLKSLKQSIEKLERDTSLSLIYRKCKIIVDPLSRYSPIR